MSLRERIYAIGMMTFAVLSMIIPLTLATVSIFV